MSKHIIEATNYGNCRYVGEYVKESASFYTYRYESNGRSREARRAKSADMRVVETDDPQSVVSAFGAEWRRHTVAVSELCTAYLNACHKQKSEALKAAFGETAEREQA